MCYNVNVNLMRKRASKYVIPNTERIHHHLVVSEETHFAVKVYASRRRLTITEATQELLKAVLEKEIRSAQLK